MASKWLEVGQFGQSVWYDNVARPAVQTGLLQRIIDEDGVTGGTSNPSIFAKNVEESGLYDDAIRAVPASATAAEAFQIEVEADLAFDAPRTVLRAHELHAAVARPNVMIKVPGTAPGIESFRQLTRDGLSINVTLLFSVERYLAIAEAYVAGLAERHAAGEPLTGIQSVASFFVSRIDTKVDALLPEGSPLRGKAAVANAKIAYADVYRKVFEGAAWQPLAAAGAARQRPLWASTSTKNAAYSPTIYVDDLIGPDTVNTVPDATLEAFRTLGNPGSRIMEGLDEARRVMVDIAAAGVDFAAVTKTLEDEGVTQFAQAYEGMLEAIQKRRAAVSG